MTRFVHAGVALTILAACGGAPPSVPSRLGFATSAETSGPLPGAGSGPTRIDFVSADPPAGTTVSDCGSDARGCPGRLRMVFRLTPTTTGTATSFTVVLSGASDRPCFRAGTGSLPLQAPIATVVQVVLDPLEGCTTPFAATALRADLEGDAVTARQEWTIGYTFAP